MKFLVFMPDGLVYGSSNLTSDRIQRITYLGGTVFEDVPDPDNFNLILDANDPAGYRAMTQQEIDAKTATAEAAFQASKSDKLKSAENAYLSVILGMGLAANADSATIFGALAYMKANNTTFPFNGIDLSSGELGTLIQALMHDVEVNGGSYATLPSQLHT